jgi:hypothetical protein
LGGGVDDAFQGLGHVRLEAALELHLDGRDFDGLGVTEHRREVIVLMQLVLAVGGHISGARGCVPVVAAPV